MALRCCSPRSIIVTASIISVVQGVIFLAIALYGILLHECQATGLDQTKILQLINVIYFSTPCSSNLTVGGTSFKVTGDNPGAEKTFYIMCVYVVLNCLWIPASFFLLAQTVGQESMKAKTLHWLHYPWVGVTVACLTMDILAFIIYSLDFSHTESFKDLLTAFNIVSTPDPPKEVEDLNIVSLPTVIMVLFFIRLGVIWLLNLLLIVFVIRGAKDIFTARTEVETKIGAIAAENLPPLPSNFPHKLPRTKSTTTIATSSVYALPRLVTKDGFFTKAESDTSSQSPLHLAALQGFSYEKTDLSQLAGVNSSITSKDGTHRRGYNDVKQSRTMLPPTLLRNQLPWSYFRSRDGPASPPRPNSSDPSVDSRAVPVPDYTQHLQRQHHQRAGPESGRSS